MKEIDVIRPASLKYLTEVFVFKIKKDAFEVHPFCLIQIMITDSNRYDTQRISFLSSCPGYLCPGV